MASSGIPLGKWSGSDSTDKLHKTVLEIDKATNKKTNIIIALTVISILVSLVGLFVSIISWLT